MEANIILKKYDKYDEADKKFKVRTAKDTGAMNVGLRLRVCANFLDKKWIELRDERSKLVSNQGKCCDFERVSKYKNYSHSECSFINLSSTKICEPCQFYQESIKKIDDAMKELNDASKCFIDEANYDDTWR